jgi:Fe2+ or Zn2+ uptake regulation protein
MEDLVATSERRLKAAGKRITPQRKLVLGILAQASGHLDAYDIFDRGRHQDASLSLSTVYRTLSVLKETGVVHELHLDDEHHHYELDRKDQHSHLVCLACGQVIEMDTAIFSETVTAVGETHGFEIASAQVELAGYCADCRRSKQPVPDRTRGDQRSSE